MSKPIECWSVDEEQYNFGSKEEVIDYLWHDSFDSTGVFLVGQKIFQAEAVHPKASRFVPDVCWVLEEMGNSAWDECGEWAEDFPDCSKEAQKLLTNYLKRWADKYCKVTFFNVTNVKPYEITQEDVDQYLKDKQND